MSQQILLLGVDMDLSPATSAMLQMARSFLVQLCNEGRPDVPYNGRGLCWCKVASRLDVWKCRCVRACPPRNW